MSKNAEMKVSTKPNSAQLLEVCAASVHVVYDYGLTADQAIAEVIRIEGFAMLHDYYPTKSLINHKNQKMHYNDDVAGRLTKVELVGYRIDHKAISMLIHAKEQQTGFDELLDRATKQADCDFKEAEQREATEEKLNTLSAIKANLRVFRHKVTKWHSELIDVAVNIGQGQAHDFLVLSSTAHADGLSRFTKSSLYIWAQNICGRKIKNWATVAVQITPRWEDVTFRLLPNNRISLAVNGLERGIHHIETTVLVDKRTKKFSQTGNFLAIVAREKALPPPPNAATRGGVKKTMSQLRSALKAIAKMEGDPFYNFNRADGWKPRFRISDRRKAADERAKEKAIHVACSDGNRTVDLHGNPSTEVFDPHAAYSYDSEEVPDDASEFLDSEDGST